MPKSKHWGQENKTNSLEQPVTRRRAVPRFLFTHKQTPQILFLITQTEITCLTLEQLRMCINTLILISEGMKFVGTKDTNLEQISVPYKYEMKFKRTKIISEIESFDGSMDNNFNTETISIYSIDVDSNPLLSFEIQKNSCYSLATVKFLRVGEHAKAVLYLPSMGGGGR